MCIYNVAHQILLKKFQISRNLAYDGMMVSSVCCGDLVAKCFIGQNVGSSFGSLDGYG